MGRDSSKCTYLRLRWNTFSQTATHISLWFICSGAISPCQQQKALPLLCLLTEHFCSSSPYLGYLMGRMQSGRGKVPWGRCFISAANLNWSKQETRNSFEKGWEIKSVLLGLLSGGQMPCICLAGITLNRMTILEGLELVALMTLINSACHISSVMGQERFTICRLHLLGEKALCLMCFCHKYWARAGEHILIKNIYNFGQSFPRWILSLGCLEWSFLVEKH